jgi:thioredoxin reductase (NADPH)
MSENVIIIGSGPAGLTAAIYAARANLSPIVIAGGQPGGQLTITTDVENYPGFADPIQGPWLMEQMQKQAMNVGTRFIEDVVTEVTLDSNPFQIKTASGKNFSSKTVIISTGAQAKWLGLESESYFMGHGVSGCATCDGFFFRKKIVAVIGGGNSAVEEALYLTQHASKVYLIHRRDSLKCEKILSDRLFKNEKIEVIWNHKLEEVLGDRGALKSVNGIRLSSTIDESIQDIPLDGVFIAIGHKPNTDLFKGKVELDSDGYIIVEKCTVKTNIPGVFAAGDVSDKTYRQAITAAGMGCMAALDADKFIHSL